MDGVRDGERMGLAPLKKLDCLLTEAGEGGIFESVSTVLSDNEGRSLRERPRASDTPVAASAYSSAGLRFSGICSLMSVCGSTCVGDSSPIGFAVDVKRGVGFLSSDS